MRFGSLGHLGFIKLFNGSIAVGVSGLDMYYIAVVFCWCFAGVLLVVCWLFWVDEYFMMIMILLICGFNGSNIRQC
jgi:hypothetical protein